ncbi:MAG: hypothetical protein QG645_719, partial [Patescibacteria group bacterium]|nr:hypothetical protein [Patescibacteria group bacterium]
IKLAENISSNHGFYQALVLNLTALKEWLEESARRKVGEIMQENPETPIGYHEIEFSMHEIVDGILADLEAMQSELDELRLPDSDDY